MQKTSNCINYFGNLNVTDDGFIIKSCFVAFLVLVLICVIYDLVEKARRRA